MLLGHCALMHARCLHLAAIVRVMQGAGVRLVVMVMREMDDARWLLMLVMFVLELAMLAMFLKFEIERAFARCRG